MKDYYTILGVLPTAEAVVIRAAYRALAQQYHPDCFEGDKREAHRRMTELNEAYSVLKNQDKRDEFDLMRHQANQSGDSYFTAGKSGNPPDFDPLEEDWGIANQFYGDLKEIEERLAAISWHLAYSFRALLLEEKDFENRGSVAKALEKQFFEFHFGSNLRIISFARSLILEGKHETAAKLSKAISVLGDKADPGRVLSQFQPSMPSAKMPEKDRRTLMDHYGIEFDGEMYHFGGYIYQHLENAAAYAKQCSSEAE